MKKLMTLMLGLSIVLGGAALFAGDAAGTTRTKKTTKKKVTKATKAKKTTAEMN